MWATTRIPFPTRPTRSIITDLDRQFSLGAQHAKQVSFIKVKNLFLKKLATLPSALSGSAFSYNLA
jgi:hypothetical protein